MPTHQTDWHRVVTLALRGSRFDGSLRITDLAELETFQALITELAGTIWRRSHPDRIRLPKGFEAACQLRFDHVEAGSSAVPLEARTTTALQASLFESDEERDDVYTSVIAAIDLASRGVVAAGKAERLPDELPRESMKRLGALGSTLGAGEELVIRPERWVDRPDVPVISGQVRDWIAAQVPGRYEDAIHVRGHVMAADVANGRFVLHDHEGRELSGPFTAEQERRVTTALRDHDSVVVEIVGRAIYEADGAPYRVVAVAEITPVGDVTPDAEAIRSLWSALADLGRTHGVAGLPADASENLDAYLYGDSH